PRTLNPEPSFSSSRGRRRGRGTGGSFGGLLAGVATEHSRRRKLAELVADHVFLHEHLQELVPVVNLKRMAHKLRDDRACTGPCLDGLLGFVLVEAIHFFVKLLVNVGAFFGAATHVFSEDPDWSGLNAVRCSLSADAVGACRTCGDAGSVSPTPSSGCG